MLRIKNINTYYGKVHALKNVSIHVNVGEIVALIGANGAGKTTVLNSISGITPPREGEAIFGGVNILGLPTDQIVKMGISQIPEGRQIFAPLTVSTNLELGAYHRYSRKNKPFLKKDIEEVFSFFPILRERMNQIAGTLSGGEQQMLAIGRALMSKPSLLLLDEPSMGLAPMISKDIFRMISRLKDELKTTILIVEQNAKAALQLADRGYVIETGKIIMEESSKGLLNNKEVQRAYLGKEKKEIWE
ncbi:MAG: ABC transporter ATP-binding protein [Deltaproteobacteria bacterium]|jgi:branched-chain amino acid transport system ATP-binding protein|nr:MAG: ABC transporter ATP-binding protein [Deltaproteobacteria bacterium]